MASDLFLRNDSSAALFAFLCGHSISEFGFNPCVLCALLRLKTEKLKVKTTPTSHPGDTSSGLRPPSPQGGEGNCRWICAQIGAREHYAIPRSLHQTGRLAALVTDWYAFKGNAETLKTENLKRESGKQFRHLTPALSPDEAERERKAEFLKAENLKRETEINVSFQLSKIQHLLRWFQRFSISAFQLLAAGGGRLWRRGARRFRTGWFARFPSAACSGNGRCAGWRRRDAATRHFFTPMPPSRARWRAATCRRTMFSLATLTPAWKYSRRKNGAVCSQCWTRLIRARRSSGWWRRKWPGSRNWPARQRPSRREYYERNRREWELADRIIVNSRWSYDALVKQGVPPEKLVVVPTKCYESQAESGPKSVVRVKKLKS